MRPERAIYFFRQIMLPFQGEIWNMRIFQPKAMPLGYPIYGFQPILLKSNYCINYPVSLRSTPLQNLKGIITPPSVKTDGNNNHLIISSSNH
jgi:hypothetical protein